MTEPEKLVEKMADEAEKVFPRLSNFINLGTGQATSIEIADAVLRIVLEAIERGEITEKIEGGCMYHIKLRPEFKKLLEAK